MLYLSGVSSLELRGFVHQDELISLEQLHEKKYARVLCYPKHDLKELTRRLEELKRLGVNALVFSGEKMVFGVPVLGKGCVGIVVTAYTDRGKAALKIRRVDADRAGMQHEAEMLRKANAIEVGPNLLDVTENFLLMEFVEGALLPKWVEMLSGKGTRARIRWVLRGVLGQCWRLDEEGIDHGELSTAPKHILIDVNDEPYIVDFETASVNRRVSNLTSICQYLFLGSHIAKIIKKKLGKIDRAQLIETLRNYKQERTRENFENILNACILHKV